MTSIEVVTDEDLAFDETAGRLVARSETVSAAVGHGLSGATRLDALVGARPTWVPVSMAMGSLEAFALHAHRCGPSPRVWSLELPEESRIQAGVDVLEDQGILYVDARQTATARLRVRTPTHVFDLALDDELRLYELPERSEELRSAVLEARIGSIAVVSRPELDALRSGYEVAPWLHRAFNELAASASNLDRVAAAGLVARFWEPAGPEAARRAFSDALAGRATPALRAIDWWRGQSEDAHAAVERELFAALPPFLDDLAHLAVDTSSGHDVAPAALALLHRRDDFASAALLLHSGGSDAAREALRLLDDEAALAHAFWSDVVLPDDERLRVVARNEPDAWWGAVFRYD